jgi:hypothetical protein
MTKVCLSHDIQGCDGDFDVHVTVFLTFILPLIAIGCIVLPFTDPTAATLVSVIKCLTRLQLLFVVGRWVINFVSI